MEICIGDTHSETTTVDKTNVASTVGSGILDVFATPSMIALMEMAAANCIQPNLSLGKTSVGTMINVEHAQATPIGFEATATATVIDIDRRKITFEVIATTSQGIIGRGIHTRFIINSDDFMEKVNSQTV